MGLTPRISVIIPAYNEVESIPRVLHDLPKGMHHIIVVDNASTDGTGEAARQMGATVLLEPDRGYGRACLRGTQWLSEQPASEQPDVVVFLDGDYSDYPEELSQLVETMIAAEADMVIGSRVLGRAERGSLTIQQRFGNWLATRMIRLLYGFRFSDLGPFRAVTWKAFQQLKMQDKTYGWTVEMQIKAVKHRMKVLEVPVRYRRRIGKSKISGTIKGTMKAGVKIITTIIRYV